MYAFAYRRPRTLEKLADFVAEDDGASMIAGGMSLLPAMKLHLARPSTLIDLAGVAELKGISVGPDAVTIGAMTRHADVARSEEIGNAIPGLAALAGGIGDRQVRNRGTIGGSIANNDPAACYPASVLALGASICTNKRIIPADAFFLGLFETALAKDEFIISVAFPRPAGCAYEKFPHPASRFALTGVFVANMRADRIRVAVTGAGPKVFRAAALEQALQDDFSEAAAEAVEINPEHLNSDIHGDAEYRAALIPVLAGRAVRRILSANTQAGTRSIHG
jgi:aerobic carbon-monoxide dehydrogenase medium subunit